MEVREIKNKVVWDINSLSQHVPFTQEWFYGEWQSGLGREVFRFVLENEGKRKAYAQVVKINTSLGKSFGYIPYGPILRDDLTGDERLFFINELKKFGVLHDMIFIRLDNNAFDLPLQKYQSVFQPQCERVVNISKEKEELIKSMDKSAGYSYRYAKKNGVEVEIVNVNLLNSLDRFYEGMSMSAKRNNITLYDREYYKKILEVGEENKNVFLVFTTCKGKLLVTSMVVVSGKRATQIFSGSTDFYRKLRPAVITRIEAMSFARSLGCTEFSLGGVSTREYPVKAWDGVSKFKEQFGGHVENPVKSGVIIISKFWYTLYKLRKLLG